MRSKYSIRHSRGVQIALVMLQKENEILRELLWLKHGCLEILGDSGEMQCGSCMLDFKRHSAQKIKDRFEEIDLKAIKKRFEEGE